MDQETFDAAQALKADETKQRLAEAKARVKLTGWGYRLTNLVRWLVALSVGGFVATLARSNNGVAEQFRTVASVYAVLSVAAAVAFLVMWPRRVRAVHSLVEQATSTGSGERVTDSARDALYLAWAAIGLGGFGWLVPVMGVVALVALVLGVKALVSRDGPIGHALGGIALAAIPIALLVAGFVRGLSAQTPT